MRKSDKIVGQNYILQKKSFVLFIEYSQIVGSLSLLLNLEKSQPIQGENLSLFLNQLIRLYVTILLIKGKFSE